MEIKKTTQTDIDSSSNSNGKTISPQKTGKFDGLSLKAIIEQMPVAPKHPLAGHHVLSANNPKESSRIEASSTNKVVPTSLEEFQRKTAILKPIGKIEPDLNDPKIEPDLKYPDLSSIDDKEIKGKLHQLREAIKAISKKREEEEREDSLIMENRITVEPTAPTEEQLSPIQEGEKVEDPSGDFIQSCPMMPLEYQMYQTDTNTFSSNIDQLEKWKDYTNKKINLLSVEDPKTINSITSSNAVLAIDAKEVEFYKKANSLINQFLANARKFVASKPGSLITNEEGYSFIWQFAEIEVLMKRIALEEADMHLPLAGDSQKNEIESMTNEVLIKKLKSESENYQLYVIYHQLIKSYHAARISTQPNDAKAAFCSQIFEFDREISQLKENNQLLDTTFFDDEKICQSFSALRSAEKQFNKIEKGEISCVVS